MNERRTEGCLEEIRGSRSPASLFRLGPQTTPTYAFYKANDYDSCIGAATLLRDLVLPGFPGARSRNGSPRQCSCHSRSPCRRHRPTSGVICGPSRNRDAGDLLPQFLRGSLRFALLVHQEETFIVELFGGLFDKGVVLENILVVDSHTSEAELHPPREGARAPRRARGRTAAQAGERWNRRKVLVMRASCAVSP